MHDSASPVDHPWNLTPSEAVSLQRELAQYVIRDDRLGEVGSVAGVDVGFEGGEARAAVAVLSFPSLDLVDQAIVRMPIQFPYVPGLLSFREIPAVLAALRQLTPGSSAVRRAGYRTSAPLRLRQPSRTCKRHPFNWRGKEQIDRRARRGAMRERSMDAARALGVRSSAPCYGPAPGLHPSSYRLDTASVYRRLSPTCWRAPHAIDCRKRPVGRTAWHQDRPERIRAGAEKRRGGPRPPR